MGKPSNEYHHGNLRQALLEAAFAAARIAGVKAIRLRRLAHETGVTPAAVYRHFPSQQALMLAVQRRILDELAGHMRKALAQARLPDQPRAAALERTRVICNAYIDFAVTETQLFRTTWTKDASMPVSPPLNQCNDEPLQILRGVLAELSATGYIVAGGEELAAITLWSACHGLAVLLVDGPLRGLSEEARNVTVNQTIDAAMRGIALGETNNARITLKNKEALSPVTRASMRSSASSPHM